MKQPADITHIPSGGGIAGPHPLPSAQVAFVAPASGNEFNTLRAGILPIACWRIDDVRFAFDSSVIKAEVRKELKNLTTLVKMHAPESKSDGNPGCPLSVFGHADPTGDDEYNKQLSSRRATAIYALLTRDTNLWEKLFSQPFGNDNWGKIALQLMLDFVSEQPEGASQDEVDQHQRDSGKRKQLFAQYMDKLCGPDLKLEKRDFLGHGDDPNGKADYQGCSEFNPVLLFSQEDQTQFDQDQDKKDRNEANAPNRRVMVLIFRAGSRVSPSKWPCPRANEGAAGCRKRFWSDGEERRTTHLPGAPRKFEETRDTFACRFYQRLTSKGPCERILVQFSFRLYDLERRFIAQAPFELSIGGRPAIQDHADDQGVVVVPDVEVPAQIFLRWGFPAEGEQEARLVFEGQMFLTPEDADREVEARQKLQNLGYSQEISLELNVAAFRRDYSQLADPPLSEDGGLDNATMSLLRNVWASAKDDLFKDKPEHNGNS